MSFSRMLILIIDIHQHHLYKTLRAGVGHTSICCSVQFLPWSPWEGLDSKLITWDFSKGRPYKIVDFGFGPRQLCEGICYCEVDFSR
nr:hypothetical protein CFP56_34412 [Quercus suber]